MKIHLTCSLLLTLLLTTAVAAQQTDPVDLTVLDHSWRKEYIGDSASNPLQPNEDLMRQTRAEKQVIRQRDYDLPNQPVQRPLPVPGPRPITGRGREVYVYKITVKNNGAKLIKQIEWEFRFLHPDTQEVLGSRRLASKVKLSPGKTRVIKAESIQQPTRVVVADQLDKKYYDQFKEEVIIHRIVYSDGSSWRRQP
jgi:hypothetical protein